MISVQDAVEHIRSVRPKPTHETMPLTKAFGRVLARDVTALVDMPPCSTSNMDGYALSECATGDQLEVIGESAAGHPFSGNLMPGTAIRISTGAMIPGGADRVLIQENAKLTGTALTVGIAPTLGEHLRSAGSDFIAGAPLISSGRRLSAADLNLVAAAGHAEVKVNCKLRVAILSSGDELRLPGSNLKNGEIYAANAVGLKPLLESWEADVMDFGLISDRPGAVAALLPSLASYDIIVPIGGASVGDHDYMRTSFRDAGFKLVFENVAIRPGKPSWMGKKGGQIVFGLPGNPASAFVCAYLFLKPMLGQDTKAFQAILDEALEENGPRETYLRAKATLSKGQLSVIRESAQNSFRLRPQSNANVLIKVPAMGGPYNAGELVDILLLGDLAEGG